MRPLPDDLEQGTIVVLPSATFPSSELRKIVGIQHYEERLLCTTLLLRHDDLRIVYLTSLPVDEAVVDYYLRFLPDPADARSRLHLLSVGDPEPRALTEKVLEAPRVMEQVRDLAGEQAYVLPFNVTPLEAELSDWLDLPVFGPRIDLVELGSKSGSRRVARRAGVPVLEGEEDVWSEVHVESALERLRTRRPDAVAALVKLNNGFSGQGTAIVELSGEGSLSEADVTCIASEETWASFTAKLAAEGGIVEELVRGPEVISPSVQVRITPAGAVEILSNHDQILGGLENQVYLGCSFPARADYRLDIQDCARRVGEVLAADGVVGPFGIDFVLVPDGEGGYRTHLTEINLRMGGTTHPFWMARLVTGGSYDASRGELVTEHGPRTYIATDNLKHEALVGAAPADVIAEVDRRGLAYDPATATGVTLHLLGALREHGKMGVLCIAETTEAARELHEEVTAALTGRLW
jgi:pheganomycin biosynthesis PGM1-like protein/ATP-grasp domain-containing protein